MELTHTHARARAHAARRGWETYVRAVDVPLEAGLRRPLRLTRHHLGDAVIGAALGQAGDHWLPCRETAVCQRPGLCGTSSGGTPDPPAGRGRLLTFYHQLEAAAAHQTRHGGLTHVDPRVSKGQPAQRGLLHGPPVLRTGDTASPLGLHQAWNPPSCYIICV